MDVSSAPQVMEWCTANQSLISTRRRLSTPVIVNIIQGFSGRYYIYKSCTVQLNLRGYQDWQRGIMHCINNRTLRSPPSSSTITFLNGLQLQMRLEYVNIRNPTDRDLEVRVNKLDQTSGSAPIRRPCSLKGCSLTRTSREKAEQHKPLVGLEASTL